MEKPKPEDFNLSASDIEAKENLEQLEESAPSVIGLIGGLCALCWGIYEFPWSLPSTFVGWTIVPFGLLLLGFGLFMIGGLFTVLAALTVFLPFRFFLGLGEKSNYSKYKRAVDSFHWYQRRLGEEHILDAYAVVSKLGKCLVNSTTNFIPRSAIGYDLQQIDSAFQSVVTHKINDSDEIEKLRLG